jgi:polysaccharide export outer membrane protein
MLSTFFRCSVAALVLVATLSCSSSPSSTAPAASASVQRQPGAASAPQPSGNLIPAVIGIPPDPGSAAVHKISAGDVLTVDVFQVDELSTEERVGDSGSIVMPLIGTVNVAGLTTEQAESKIAAALRQDYLQDPQVNVFVKEYANMRITVGGAVEKPGVFPLTGTTTLLQAIAQAEGVTNLANEKEVVVFRTNQTNDINAYVVNIKEIQQGQMHDPVLASNDKIIVPKSGTAVFFTNVRDSLRGFINFGMLGL